MPAPPGAGTGRLQQELERRETAEKRLQAAYNAVEQRVRERTAQLRQVNQSLVAEIAEPEQTGDHRGDLSAG